MYKIENIIIKNSYLDDKSIYYHKKLYISYLKKLNELLIKNNYDFRYSKKELISKIDIFNLNDRDDILYYLGAVLNHELYFNIITNNSNNKYFYDFIKIIEKRYTSLLNFKLEFKNISNKLVGSGFTFLVIDNNNELNIINLSNNETPYLYGYTPLIAMDLWEHSYYLKYNIDKEKYIDDFLNNLNYEYIVKNKQ